MLATLNILISLVFILLLFSLLSSTVMEVIAAMLSLRSKHLRVTLENMLGEKMGDFLRHPLFKQLSYATNQRTRITDYSMPTYLGKGTFTAILQDIMDADSTQKLADQIKSLDEGDLKRMMQFMFRRAGGDPVKFQAEVEQWFDQVMERASDWYSRNIKWWLFGVGLVMATIFNADTIHMYQNISSNSSLQERLSSIATDYANNTDSVKGPNYKLSLTESVNHFAEMDSLLKTKIEPLRSPLGLGWDSGLPAKNQFWWWMVKLAGLILTGIAVTFGAPFWFNLLKKLVTLRTGDITAKASDQSQQQPASDQQQGTSNTPADTDDSSNTAEQPDPTGAGKPVG
jgi:hypothetical protein